MSVNYQYIIIHHSGTRRKNQDVNVIDRWHKARGWAKVGYHFVVLNDAMDEWWRDGEVQAGRALGKAGAHVLGLNDSSIGVCVVGNGDMRPWTYRQLVSVVHLCARLCKEYDIKTHNVLGHKEVSRLVSDGVLEKRYEPDTRCPGVLVRMDGVRDQIAERLRCGCR